MSGEKTRRGRAGALRRLRRARSAGWLVCLAAGGLLLPAAGGCGGEEDDGAKVVTVWCHQGQEAENRAMRRIVEAFNAAHRQQGLRVQIDFFPDSQYTEKLLSAAAAGRLPDAMDVDGPLVAKLAEAGLIQPIGPWIDPETRADFLPTIIEQGTIDEKLYALGAFDSALVLYYDRPMFEQAGVQPPPKMQAWTWEQFLAACGQLKAAGIRPVAMHMNISGAEWYTYAFSPLIWSAGGRLIDQRGARVAGVLNDPTNVRVLEAWREVFAAGYASADPVQTDAFGAGKTAMDWFGHWMARDHLQAKGDRLGVMPLPKMGGEPAAACGSWCWCLSATAADAEAAMTWLRWCVHPRRGIGPIVRANGAIPARRSAFELFPEYQRMPYALFRRQLETVARPRPKTPYYDTLTDQFAAAVRDIAHGAEAGARLTTAAENVQRVIDRSR
jgi:multiple sugar transport system substrate-binding protein